MICHKQMIKIFLSKVDQELVPIDIQEAFTVFDNVSGQMCTLLQFLYTHDNFVQYQTNQDGNGNITRSELRHVMMNLGEKMTEEECDFLCEVPFRVYSVTLTKFET